MTPSTDGLTHVIHVSNIFVQHFMKLYARWAFGDAYGDFTDREQLVDAWNRRHAEKWVWTQEESQCVNMLETWRHWERELMQRLPEENFKEKKDDE